jgi:hypothetical protein
VRGFLVVCLALVAASAPAGCTGTGTVPCGDARCPAGFVCETAAGAAPLCVVGSGECTPERDGLRCEGTGAPICAGGTCGASRCGDGFVDPTRGELCDLGSGNSLDKDAACRQGLCRPAGCGDAVIDTGEECDDGPGNDDFAPGQCRRTVCREAWCGDGVVDEGEGPSCLGPYEPVIPVLAPEAPILASGDFDGDGLTDMVLPNDSTNGDGPTIAIYFPDPGGGVSELRLSGGGAAYNGDEGDLDGDGDLDLVVVGVDTTLADAAWIFYNQGERQFSGRTAPELAHLAVVQLGDLDGDGDADLIGADLLGALERRLADGAGGFGPALPAAGTPVEQIEMGDVDGDGRADLAMISRLGVLTVARAQPDGSLGPPEVPPSGDSADGRLWATDLDADGLADLVMASSPDLEGEVTLWRSLGGTFAAPLIYPAVLEPEQVLVGDLDGDGFRDVLVTSPDPYRWRVLRGAPGGAYLVEPPQGDDARPLSLDVLADVDGDGLLDVLAHDLDTAGWVPGGDGPFGRHHALMSIPDFIDSMVGVVDVDLDGDGARELCLSTGVEVVCAPLLGGGRVGPVVAAAPLAGAILRTHADLDGVPGDELVLTTPGDVVVVGLVPGGIGERARRAVVSSGLGTVAVVPRPGGAPADLAVQAPESLSSVRTDVLHLDPASGTLVVRATWQAGWAATPRPGVAAGDVDGDGRTDLLSVEPSGLIVYPGLPDDTLAAPRVLELGVEAVAVGDLDGDGDADLVVGRDDRLEVRLQGPAGTFTASGWDVPDAAGPRLVEANGDGHLDLVHEEIAGVPQVRLGDGHGRFGPAALVDPPGARISLVDATLDGRLDVVYPKPSDTSGLVIAAGRLRRDASF